MPPTDPTQKKPLSGQERRRWLRAACDMPVSLNLGGTRCEAKLRDLSRAGVCFFLDRPIPMMTVLDVTLEVSMPQGAKKRIKGHGAVVRCERISKAVDHWEVAVFLNDMAEADRRAMEEYVGTRPPMA